MLAWHIVLYVLLSVSLGALLHEAELREDEPSTYERLKRWARPYALHLAYIWAHYSDECERG